MGWEGRGRKNTYMLHFTFLFPLFSKISVPRGFAEKTYKLLLVYGKELVTSKEGAGFSRLHLTCAVPATTPDVGTLRRCRRRHLRSVHEGPPGTLIFSLTGEPNSLLYVSSPEPHLLSSSLGGHPLSPISNDAVMQCSVLTRWVSCRPGSSHNIVQCQRHEKHHVPHMY